MSTSYTPLTVTETVQFISEVLPFTMNSQTLRALRAALDARRDVRMYRVHQESSPSEDEDSQATQSPGYGTVYPGFVGQALLDALESPELPQEIPEVEQDYESSVVSPVRTPSPTRGFEGLPVDATTAFYCPNAEEEIAKLNGDEASSPSLNVEEETGTASPPRGYKGLPVDANTAFYCPDAEEAINELREMNGEASSPIAYSPSASPSPPRGHKGLPVDANTAFYCPDADEAIEDIRRRVRRQMDGEASSPSASSPSSSPSPPRGYRGLPIDANTAFYCPDAEEAIEELRAMNGDAPSPSRSSLPSSPAPLDPPQTLEDYYPGFQYTEAYDPGFMNAPRRNNSPLFATAQALCQHFDGRQCMPLEEFYGWYITHLEDIGFFPTQATSPQPEGFVIGTVSPSRASSPSEEEEGEIEEELRSGEDEGICLPGDVSPAATTTAPTTEAPPAASLSSYAPGISAPLKRRRPGEDEEDDSDYVLPPQKTRRRAT
ncbi:hypothetical protein DM02DRAFT_650043 [Periconia macrospinosa]|uniref:Uncharacterized protein n=1 Tax=Periconia macrospinosa TaxID=97972 RepID=A0A2V1E913_9PLEO|nr:hypothetical protein DM02DRAFT_650043 [Periconia macrospinosa]